jgi:ABC-2 type transport system permease protein
MSVLNGKYALLVRREFWEHRALWLAPAAVAIGFPILAMFTGGDFHLGPGNAMELSAPNIPAGWGRFFGMAVMGMMTSLVGMVACITMFVYLLDCLYAERKDRSILFWKSLPVSDAETVLAKLAVALLLLPLLAVALALVGTLLMVSLGALLYAPARELFGMGFLSGSVGIVPSLLLLWVYCVLWYLPFVAYLTLASVLARRVPLMYAVLPPVALVVAERVLLGGTRVAQFLGERIAPWTRESWAWQNAFERGPGMPPPEALIAPDWSALFSDPGLWIGLVAGAAMVYIVIRLRRYRDDT